MTSLEQLLSIGRRIRGLVVPVSGAGPTPPEGFATLFVHRASGLLAMRKADGTTTTIGSGGGGAPSGAAGGDLGGTYPSPTVTQARGLRESGGTTLAMATVADGEVLFRSGSTVDGKAIGTTAGTLAAGDDARFTRGWPLATYGTGTDGAADLDGANTVAWASKSGSVYTMTRNAYLTDLTVRAGCTLVKRWIPHVNGTLTVEATGIVHDDGNAASGSTGGAGIGATGRLPEATAAGTGGTGKTVSSGAGLSSGGTNPGVGARGGSGGAAGVNLGGGAGLVTEPDVASGGIQQPGFIYNWLLRAATNWIRIGGGSGGGGGGITIVTGTASGGGGGGGAPVSLLFARTIVNNGTIRCNGGAGAAGVFTGTSVAGGGGGGGGGYLIVVTDSTPTGTFQANGGAHGAGANGGTNGVAGSNGTVEYRTAA